MFKEFKNIFKSKEKQGKKLKNNLECDSEVSSKRSGRQPVEIVKDSSTNLTDELKHCSSDISVSPKDDSFSKPKEELLNNNKKTKDIKFNQADLDNDNSHISGDKTRLQSIISRNTEGTHTSSIVSLDSCWVDEDYENEEEDDRQSSFDLEAAEDEDELIKNNAAVTNQKTVVSKKHHRPVNTQPQTFKVQRTLFTEQSEIDDYLLLEKIGEGAFSQVYKCVKYDMMQIYQNLKDFEESDDDEYFAVKVINKQMLDMTSSKKDKEKNKMSSREQVLKEIMIHKLVSNRQAFKSGAANVADELKNDIDTNADDGVAHIVKYVDFYETECYYYMIQELVTGGEIFGEVVKYTYFSEDLSRFVVRQLAFAIKHLHSLGVVHRDIKLENLLFETIPIFERNLSKNDPELVFRKSDDPNNKLDEGIFIPSVGSGTIGLVKLADFGLSKQVVNINAADLSTPCGTVGYTAPEVVRDERYSYQVDLWGIGCVLYTVLCGFPPFYDERIDVLTEKISKGEYTFLKPWWDEISDGAKNCVSKLLEIDPLKRYTVDQLLTDPWFSTYDCQAYYSIETQNRIQSLQNKVFERRKKRLLKTQKIKATVINEPIDDDFVYKIPIKTSIDTTNTMLYSPAAVAMRDAFDITNAVQRINEEQNNSPDISSNNKTINFAKQATKNNKGTTGLSKISEDAETETFTDYANAVESNQMDQKFFQLKLNSSTIVKRRHNEINKKNRKQSPLSPTAGDVRSERQSGISSQTFSSPLRQNIE
ncbi:hypothetical protein QEN19_003325 [Hanseniaspora menglaensis]